MKKIIILIILIMTSVSFAVPQKINYRGKIFESGGPVNGSRNFDFQMFDQLTGGVSLWDSGSQSLVVNNGYYNYTFNVMSEMFTNENLYLEVQVEGTTLTPRERFVSVGYAMNADMVDGQHATNLQYWQRSGNNIYRDTGNIGIGTNAPVEKLHVNGNIRMPVTTTNAGILYAGTHPFLHNYGTGNSFLGMNAGNLTLTGTYNIGIGDSALNSLTSGNNNVGVGNSALGALTIGQRNTAIGRLAGGLITSGSYNVLMGYDAGRQCLNNNVVLGYYAGYNTTGSGNVFLGYAAGYNGDHTDKLYIDNSTTTTPLIWGDFAGNIVNINGNLGIGTNNPQQRLHVNGNICMPATTTNTGVLYAGTNRFLHNFGTKNVFLGIGTGNLTLSGGNNTGIGDSSLSSLTSGTYNVGVGTFALIKLTTGHGNTAIGHRAGQFITSGLDNALMGYAAGYNITGSRNVLMGNSAGQKCVNYNVALGYEAGYSTTGSGNVFLGYAAGYSETGSDKLYIDNSSTSTPLIWGDFAGNIVNINGNLGIGTNNPQQRLHVNGNIRMPETTTNAGVLYAGTNRFLHNFGTKNVFLGIGTGNLTLSGGNNTGIGDSSLSSLTSGTYNVGVGTFALTALTTGQRNTAIGRLAGGLITSGSYNVLMGYAAGYNITGSRNVLMGNSAGYQCLNNNVALGYYAGYNTTGSGNVFLGYAAGYQGDHTNKLYIDNSSTSTPLIWGDFANDIFKVNGSAVFNETGNANYDFRIEGDTQPNLFFADASADKITMGTTSPYDSSLLTIVGKIAVDGSYGIEARNSNGVVFKDYNGNSVASFTPTGLRLYKNPGTGSTPSNYIYQGSPNDTSRKYALSVHDAFWVTKSVYFTGLSGTSANPYVRINTATGQLYYDSSTKRNKENIRPFSDSFEKILNLEPKIYRDKGSKTTEIGYIAEDIDAMGLKHLDTYDTKGLPNGIHYERVPIYTLEVVKRQEKRINALQQKVENLSKEINELKALIKNKN